MALAEWLTLAALAVCGAGLFLGMRRGRQRLAAALSDAHATGHAEAVAALQAHVNQNVTVVAGNEHYGAGEHQALGDGAVRYGLRHDERVSVGGSWAAPLAEGLSADDRAIRSNGAHASGRISLMGLPRSLGGDAPDLDRLDLDLDQDEP
jgi:hypothetical protein